MNTRTCKNCGMQIWYNHAITYPQTIFLGHGYVQEATGDQTESQICKHPYDKTPDLMMHNLSAGIAKPVDQPEAKEAR